MDAGGFECGFIIGICGSDVLLFENVSKGGLSRRSNRGGRQLLFKNVGQGGLSGEFALWCGPSRCGQGGG